MLLHVLFKPVRIYSLLFIENIVIICSQFDGNQQNNEKNVYTLTEIAKTSFRSNFPKVFYIFQKTVDVYVSVFNECVNNKRQFIHVSPYSVRMPLYNVVFQFQFSSVTHV